MKKVVQCYLFLMVLFGVGTLHAQEGHGISFGMTPFGRMDIRSTESAGSKSDRLSHQYSMSTPIYQLGFETHRTSIKDLLLEACYSKLDLRDETGYSYLNSDSYAFYAYFGYNTLSHARVQFPFYLGVGANYINALKADGFFIDFAVRARIKVYLTNRIAIYGGAYYHMGLGGKKLSENRYGLDTGLLFSFY